MLALVFGYRARREIKSSAGRQKGSGLTTTGIIVGWIGIAILAARVVAAIAIAVAASTSGGTPAPVSAP